MTIRRDFSGQNQQYVCLHITSLKGYTEKMQLYPNIKNFKITVPDVSVSIAFIEILLQQFHQVLAIIIFHQG